MMVAQMQQLCCIRVFEKPDDCNGAGLAGLSTRNGSVAVRGLLYTNIKHELGAQHKRSKSTRSQPITTISNRSIGLLYFSSTCMPVMSLSLVVWHLAVATPEQAVLLRTSTQRPALVTCADLPTDLGRRPTLNHQGDPIILNQAHSQLHQLHSTLIDLTSVMT